MSWLTESIRTIRALNRPENAPPLDPFPKINIEGIPPASVLLFYGDPGVKMTQRLGVHIYGCKYHPPFHAAIMLRDGLIHNVGKFRTDKLLEPELRDTRRVDVLIYPMIEDQRRAIIQAAELDTSIPHTGIETTDYGIGQFLNFGFSFIGKGKQPVCSADVVKIMAVGRIECSDRESSETAPWDIFDHAMKNQLTVEKRTVWIGEKYFPQMKKNP